MIVDFFQSASVAELAFLLLFLAGALWLLKFILMLRLWVVFLTLLILAHIL